MPLQALRARTEPKRWILREKGSVMSVVVVGSTRSTAYGRANNDPNCALSDSPRRPWASRPARTLMIPSNAALPVVFGEQLPALR